MFAILATLGALGVVGAALFMGSNEPDAPEKSDSPRPNPLPRQRSDDPDTLVDLDLVLTGDRTYEGNIGGYKVRIQFGESDAYVRVLGLPDDITIRRMSDPGFSQSDFVTGDPVFDTHWWVRGNPARLAVVLEATHRAQLMALPGLHLEGGTLSMVSGFRHVQTCLKDAIRVARSMDIEPDEMTAWLVRRFTSETAPVARLGILRALITAGGPLADQTAKKALLDNDPQVRFCAAAASGPKGIEQLIVMLKSDDLPEAAVVAGLDALVQTRQFPALQAILPTLRESKRPNIKVAALRATLAFPDADPTSILVKEARGKDPQMAAAAADALSDRADEKTLLELLTSADPAVIVSAAKGLARTGGPQSVDKLLLLTTGPQKSPEVKSAARNAILQIQTRHRKDASAAAPGSTVSVTTPGNVLSFEQAARARYPRA